MFVYACRYDTSAEDTCLKNYKLLCFDGQANWFKTWTSLPAAEVLESNSH